MLIRLLLALLTSLTLVAVSVTAASGSTFPKRDEFTVFVGAGTGISPESPFSGPFSTTMVGQLVATSKWSGPASSATLTISGPSSCTVTSSAKTISCTIEAAAIGDYTFTLTPNGASNSVNGIAELYP